VGTITGASSATSCVGNQGTGLGVIAIGSSSEDWGLKAGSKRLMAGAGWQGLGEQEWTEDAAIGPTHWRLLLATEGTESLPKP
jgi:hypothetical protein